MDVVKIELSKVDRQYLWRAGMSDVSVETLLLRGDDRDKYNGNV